MSALPPYVHILIIIATRFCNTMTGGDEGQYSGGGERASVGCSDMTSD